MSNHKVSQSLRQKSFSLVPNICISKYGLVQSQLSLIFIWCFLWESKLSFSRRFHLFIMFIVSAVTQVSATIPRPRPGQVFGLVVSIVSVSSTTGDIQALSFLVSKKCDKSALNCSDHKLTQLLINRPVAVPSNSCVFQEFVDQTQISFIMIFPHGTQDIPHMHHDIAHGTEHPHCTAHTLYRVDMSSCCLRLISAV